MGVVLARLLAFDPYNTNCYLSFVIKLKWVADNSYNTNCYLSFVIKPPIEWVPDKGTDCMMCLGWIPFYVFESSRNTMIMKVEANGVWKLEHKVTFN